LSVRFDRNAYGWLFFLAIPRPTSAYRFDHAARPSRENPRESAAESSACSDSRGTHARSPTGKTSVSGPCRQDTPTMLAFTSIFTSDEDCGENGDGEHAEAAG
jgi:hypothetical protein